MFKEVKIESIPKIKKGRREANVLKDVRDFYKIGIMAAELIFPNTKILQVQGLRITAPLRNCKFL